MHFKVTIATWLLAILFISQTICDDKDDKDEKKDRKDTGHGSSSGSGSHGSSGSSGSSGGSGSSGSSGSSGNKITGMGNMTFSGMSGIQLPFPFFPPFGCDMTCQPMQLQIFQQQVQQEMVAPTTHAPMTTPPPKTTTTTHKPLPTTTPMTYTSQTIIMYPNWCQGWCKFFYQPPPQPVYYQPNCLLFSWMGMGSGMAMGTQTMHS